MHRCKHICKPLQADPQTKVCKRASTSSTREKLFFKISFPSKIFKTATAQPTHKDQNTSLTMTAKPTADNDLPNSTDRTPAGNSTYKKLAVQWLNEVQIFNQSFVQVKSFVLRNRQLLIAAKRYGQVYEQTTKRQSEQTRELPEEKFYSS
jgi:hypothetical protein